MFKSTDYSLYSMAVITNDFTGFSHNRKMQVTTNFTDLYIIIKGFIRLALDIDK